MTENEQIEEMAKDIDSENDCIIPCRECPYYTHPNCRDVKSAERLYYKGYRKVKRGEWILIGNGNGRPIHWKCSVCGYETLDAPNGDTNFCPNCGADM